MRHPKLPGVLLTLAFIGLFLTELGRAVVRFDVVGAPTEVVTTGRAEVLGTINFIPRGAGNVTGTSTGGSTQIGLIFTNPGVAVDNTTASGIKVFYSAGFSSASPSIVSVENRDLGGRCTGFITLNLLPGATPGPADFVRIEGVRGRVDASAGILAGTDLWVDLQSVNDPAGNLFTPDRIRVAKALKGMTVSIYSDTLTYQITITEGFSRAFVDRDANNDGLNSNDRTDSSGSGTGAPTNSTQVLLRMDAIPDGVSGVGWPASTTSATTGARLYLIESTFTPGTAGTSTALYSFETPNQVNTSDIAIESFTLVPPYYYVAGSCDTSMVTTSVTLAPATPRETGCAAPDPAGPRPRFLNAAELQITSFSPATVTAGTGPFTLTVNGTGFQASSIVQWNGGDRPTTFVSATQLTAAIPASDIATPRTVTITVVDPALGGAVSNARSFVVAQPGLTLYFPRVVSSAGSGPETSDYTGLAFANNTGRIATLRLTYYDRRGVVLTGPGINNPTALTLPAGQQRPFVDNQVFGASFTDPSRIGWVKVEGDVAQVVGFFLGFNSSLTRLDGADVSGAPLASFVFTDVEEQGFTQVHIANPSDVAVTLTIELLAGDGTPRAQTISRSVNAYGVLAESIQELFPGVVAQATDYVRVASTRGVVPFEYLGRPGRDVRALNGQDATGGAQLVFAPQYVVGPGWNSVLEIVNLEATAAMLSLRLVADDGSTIGAPRTVPIAANGKLVIADQNYFVDPAGTVRQGYVEIRSNGVRLAGNVVFGSPTSGLSSTLPISARALNQAILGHVVSNGTYFTGIALINPTDISANSVIQVFDSGGTQIASKIETLPSRGRRSLLLREYFPHLTGLDINSGYVTVNTGNANIIVVALFGTHSGSVLSAIPAQTVP